MNITLIWKETCQSFDLSLKNLQDVKNYIDANEMISLNDREIDLNKTFDENKITDGDVLFVTDPKEHIEDLLPNVSDVLEQSNTTLEIPKNNDLMSINDAIEMYPEELIVYSPMFLKTIINDVTCKTLVDTGADFSVISHQMAKTLNLEHLINTNFQSIVTGVGQGVSIGRIFNCHMLIENVSTYTTFIVMQDDNIKSVIGRNFLHKYGCMLNFKNNTMTINDVNVKLLNDQEINLLEFPHVEKIAQFANEYHKLLNMFDNDDRELVNFSVDQICHEIKNKKKTNHELLINIFKKYGDINTFLNIIGLQYSESIDELNVVNDSHFRCLDRLINCA